MAMWEIMITCRNGSRLCFSELRRPRAEEGRDHRDGGRRENNQSEDAYREEQSTGSRTPFFKVMARET
jgi:hypothetical protein